MSPANAAPILAIDPGPEVSAYLALDQKAQILEMAILPNLSLIPVLEHFNGYATFACEWVESFGMPVGQDIFRTCRWVGRFEQAVRPSTLAEVTRRAVKLHLCNSARAKDQNVSQALLDRFGDGTRKNTVGSKLHPGPLYGVKSHLWAALAVAITYLETAQIPATCKIGH